MKLLQPPDVKLYPAHKPKKTLESPVLLEARELPLPNFMPRETLCEAPLFFPASDPIKTLPHQVVDSDPASFPMKILSQPTVRQLPAWKPKATL